MSQRFFYATGPLVLAAVATAVPAAAQTVAAGPYYATPSWDQKIACDNASNCPRFIVLSNWNNDAVLDRDTGLVWEKSPDDTLRTWAQAVSHCTVLKLGNRLGWRLPLAHELATLIDPTVPHPGPRLPPGHPFSNVVSPYWSASTSPYNAAAAWYVGFGRFDNDLDPFFEKVSTFASWCVRGGQGANVQ